MLASCARRRLDEVAQIAGSVRVPAAADGGVMWPRPCRPRRSGLPGLLACRVGSSRGGWGAGVAVRDGHLLVHRRRGFDAPVGGASRRRCRRRWHVTMRSCVRRSRGVAVMSSRRRVTGSTRCSRRRRDAIDAAVAMQLELGGGVVRGDRAVAGADGDAHRRGGVPRRRLLRHGGEPCGAVDGRRRMAARS